MFRTLLVLVSSLLCYLLFIVSKIIPTDAAFAKLPKGTVDTST